MKRSQKKAISGAQLAAVGQLFAALSEPNRLMILQALHDQPLSVGEIMEHCAMKQTNVSKHLAVLHQHKLVRRERQGTTVLYEIADSMVFSLCNLVCGKIQRDAREAAATFSPEI